METVQIDATESTPSVLFNINKGLMIITGRAFPEYPEIFFNPIIDKIKDIKCPNLLLTIELEYINTASTKIMLNLLKEAKRVAEKLTVTWIYEEDDTSIQELGTYMSEFIDVEFEYKDFI